MGTRNLTCVYVDGEYKIAQYGQWDGYPEGQGVKALEALRTIDLADLTAKARAAVPISEEQIHALYAEMGIKVSDEGFIAMSEYERFQTAYPQLGRDLAAGILAFLVSQPSGLRVNLDLDFAGDGLYCEWGYVVDLDARTFEVFIGFQHENALEGERFAFLNRVRAEQKTPIAAEYGPVRKIATFSLDALPSQILFLARLNWVMAQLFTDDGQNVPVNPLALHANDPHFRPPDTPGLPSLQNLENAVLKMAEDKAERLRQFEADNEIAQRPPSRGANLEL